MDSTITIDGKSIRFHNPATAYGTYKTVAAIIRSGTAETVVLDGIDEGDYRVRHVFHVTSHTALHASLAYSPVVEIAASLSSQSAESLTARYTLD